MADPTPLVDLVVNDRYWLGWARKSIDASHDKRQTAGEKLVAAVAWFWTVYTAVALVGVSLTDRDLPTPAVAVVFLPTLVLVVAYLCATLALLPVDIAFDARRPRAAEAAHTQVMAKKKTRLRWALFFTALGGVTVVLAGAVLAAAESAPADPGFVADLETTTGGSVLLVAGDFPKVDKVTFRVEPTEPKDGAQSTSFLVRVEDDEVEGRQSLTGSAKSWKVTAVWTAEKVDHTMSKSVAPD